MPTRLTKGTRSSGGWGGMCVGGGTSAPASRVCAEAEGGEARTADRGGKRPGTAREGGRREGVGRGSPSARSADDEDDDRSGEEDSGSSKCPSLSSSRESCSSLSTSSSESVHPRRSPAMYSLKAARPTMTVPPSSARRRLASSVPLMDGASRDCWGASNPRAVRRSVFMSLATRVARSP